MTIWHALQCTPGGTARVLLQVLGLAVLVFVCAAAYRWRHGTARRLPLYTAVEEEVRLTTKSVLYCLSCLSVLFACVCVC
jgi:hypothetical protein